MYREEIIAIGNAAKAKIEFLKKSPLGYLLASVLAGMFIGFGILLIFTIGGLLDGAPYTKIIMGVSFGIALSLVVIAGAELFTGNNLVMTIGILEKQVRIGEAVRLWIVCWVGNLVGSIILALLFTGAGFAEGPVGQFIAGGALAKMTLPVLPLFLRGVLCNILVCLAVWCGFRCKTESGKLIMIFWCLFAFITCGFEHSVANMTLLTISLLSPCGAAVTFGGYFYNLLVVTLGNMAGAILFLAIPYFMMAKKREV
ncbi:MAG: formate/nitrite transporter family protein [Emergencia timonensis]|uniref:formate/nitrite transporter family protein n=1 Tax=Emergencia timonensis TaxID=1776384 RepID=UPI00082A960F|nr:formate/nitrite transporter family protein [Emergencia timonensis]WNX87756.1 formate/nitrite transporter family protein [Emergencia timonensis]